MKNKNKLSPEGSRTITEFFIASVQNRAEVNVEEQNRIVLSKRDHEVFFNEMLNPSIPNEALTKAAARYNSLVNSL